MILIFDLDDTLYDEMSYVMSGFRRVGHYGEIKFGWDAVESLNFMSNYLKINGRGKIFDALLKYHDCFSKKNVADCIRIYRHHDPDIQLFKSAKKILEKYHSRYPLYLVTDGHKIAQKKKVDALKLNNLFNRIFITNRFGIHNAKPSLHCFDIIRKIEKSKWSEMVYVGDNPEKDFLNLNKMGALTVRVQTGRYSNTIPKSSEYDAKIKIENLSFLPTVLNVG